MESKPDRDTGVVRRENVVMSPHPALVRHLPGQRHPWPEMPDSTHWAHWYSINVAGRAQAINGNTLLIASQMPRRKDFLYAIRRVWMVFLTSSAGDNGTNNTSVAFRVSSSGVLGTYDAIGTLSTSGAPVAGQTVEAAAYFPITDQKVIHVLVTRNAAGVDHNNDAFAFGVDIGAKRITVELGR